MSDINSAFINALLADASYVNDLVENMTAGELRDELVGRMTPALAEFIGAKFTVVTSINTPDNVIDGAGFDGVIWRGNAGTPYASKLFVSMRGTEPGADLVTDANLALRGDAAQQTADMVNWWLCETTPVGQTAPQFAWRLLTSTFENTARAPGTGRISAADLAGGVYVNGHSLGGFLAATFTRVFGTQANVLQTSTFNSAGFAFDSEPVLAALQAKVGPELGRVSFPGPHDTSQLNYFATHGLNLTTNTWWFNQVGQRVELFNEETPTQISNHFMYKLTDSLALTDAMSRLDPTLTIARANTLFEAGSNSIPASLEGALDGLRRVLVDPNAASLPIGDVSGFAFSRYAFHDALNLLQQSPAFQSLTGRVRIDLGGKDTGAKVRSDFSAMVSLLALSPVVLTGTDSANAALLQSTLQGVWGQTFTDWQADANLSLTDRQAGRLNITDEWIADRATLLESIIAHGIKDGSGTAYSSRLPAGQSYELRWVDVQGTQQLLFAENAARQGGVQTTVPSQLFSFGGNGNDVLEGSPNQLGDRLYAGGGADTLRGLGGADLLEGQSGDDSLDGGAGNDTLRGGAGNDRYAFASGSGFDAIEDADGLGTITVAGLGPIDGSNTVKVGEGVWQTPDARVNYTRLPSSTVVGSNDLYVSFSDRTDVIVIRNWSNDRRVGITLPETVTQPSAFALTGGADSLLRSDPSQSGGVPDPNAPPTQGTYVAPEVRVIDGLGGNDYIDPIDTVAPTDKRLIGGAGNDIVFGGSGNGNDIIEGGEGNDWLGGPGGHDVVYGGTGNDHIDMWSYLAQVRYDSTWTQPTALRATWQDVGYDWSWSYHWSELGPGYATDEWKMHYLVDADGNTQGLAALWQIDLASPAHEIGVLESSYDQYLQGDTIFGGSGDDLINAMDGNDIISGDTGHDVIFGSGGDDDLYGAEGADTIRSGLGNDFVFGDLPGLGTQLGSNERPFIEDSLSPPGDTDFATLGNDWLDGGDGNDALCGAAGANTLLGGEGDDQLLGEHQGTPLAYQGNDLLDGGAGNDTLEGEGGAHTNFRCFAANDKCFAEAA